jgi:hypothetical protein
VGIKAKVKAKVEVENWNIIRLRICQYGSPCEIEGFQ